MKQIKCSLLALLIVCLFTGAKGQVLTKRIKWNSHVVVDISTNDSRNISSSFISEGNSLKWTQPGRGTYEFTIESVTRSWSNENTDGSLELVIRLGTKSSKATLARSGGQLSILMAFPGAGESGKTYKFIVDTIEIL